MRRANEQLVAAKQHLMQERPQATPETLEPVQRQLSHMLTELSQVFHPQVRPEPIPSELSDFQRQRLNELGLEQVANYGGGNCQFQSAADALNAGLGHEILRENAMHIIQQNEDFFEQFLRDVPEWDRDRLPPDAPFEDVLEHFRQPGTWGNNATLVALACLSNRIIHVIRGDVEHRVEPFQSEVAEPEPIYILHFGEDHYEGTRRDMGGGRRPARCTVDSGDWRAGPRTVDTGDWHAVDCLDRAAREDRDTSPLDRASASRSDMPKLASWVLEVNKLHRRIFGGKPPKRCSERDCRVIQHCGGADTSVAG